MPAFVDTWWKAPEPRAAMGDVVSRAFAVEFAKKDEEMVTLKDMTVLRLEPGDIVVLRHPKILTSEAAQRLIESWGRVMERHGLSRVSVVVMEEGMEVGVMRGGTAG